jgi:hypothetical protein
MTNTKHKDASVRQLHVLRLIRTEYRWDLEDVVKAQSVQSRLCTQIRDAKCL